MPGLAARRVGAGPYWITALAPSAATARAAVDAVLLTVAPCAGRCAGCNSSSAAPIALTAEPPRTTPSTAATAQKAAVRGRRGTTVLHALADPGRLEIVHILDTRGETSCTALGLPLSPPAVTHHIRSLREAGIIATRTHGTARLSRLRRDDLERRFPGLLTAILGASRPPG